jgi:hypothetical protein
MCCCLGKLSSSKTRNLTSASKNGTTWILRNVLTQTAIGEAQQRFAVYALQKLPLPLSGNNKRGLVDIFKAEHLPNL